MLGVCWTEMLVIGVVALIVIGPRELPALMQRMGKVVGTIQRMGKDFQREINKTTGLDTVTDLRKSITDPLKKTTAEIRKEFNAIGSNGSVKPSGAIKPTDPKVESVVDSIKQQAGMTTPAEPVKTGAVATPAAAAAPTVSAAPAAAAVTTAPVKAAIPPKATPAPTAPVAVADLPTIEASTPAIPEPVAKTPRKRVAKPKPVDSPGPIEAIAPSEPKPRKPPKKAASGTEPQPEPAADKPGEGA
jgi:sec-independent protein translocase protein TatB